MWPVITTVAVAILGTAALEILAPPEVAEAVQVYAPAVLALALVVVTIVYAIRTADMADAAAEANRLQRERDERSQTPTLVPHFDARLERMVVTNLSHGSIAVVAAWWDRVEDDGVPALALREAATARGEVAHWVLAPNEACTLVRPLVVPHRLNVVFQYGAAGGRLFRTTVPLPDRVGRALFSSDTELGAAPLLRSTTSPHDEAGSDWPEAFRPEST